MNLIHSSKINTFNHFSEYCQNIREQTLLQNPEHSNDKHELLNILQRGTHPSHVIASSTHCTEPIACVQTQYTPSAALRSDAPLKLACTRLLLSGTHPKTLSRRIFFFRDAPKNTIAPRPFLSRDAPKPLLLLRPHADLPLLSCVRRTPTLVLCLRPFGHKTDFKTLEAITQISQISRSDHAPKRSVDFAFLRSRHYTQEIINFQI